MLREPLTRLFDRTEKIGRDGIETTQEQKIQKAESKNSDGETNSDLMLAENTGTDDEISQPGEISPPDRSSIYHEYLDPIFKSQIESIRRSINDLNTYDPEEVKELLVVELAQAQVVLNFEQILNRMWRSQLVVLDRLNRSGGNLPLEHIKDLYTQAKSEYPSYFSDYSFDNWYKYLAHEGLVIIEDGRLFISDKGKSLLVWRTRTGYDRPRHG